LNKYIGLKIVLEYIKMPRQTKNTDTKTVAQESTTPAVAPAAEPVAAAAPARKTRAKAAPATEPVAAEAPAAEPAKTEEVPKEEVAQEAAEGETKTRVVPTRESVMTDFSEILSLVDGEIERLRECADKTHSAKFLRQLHRRLRSLQSNTARVLKHKTPSARRNNNSGFLKPVNISGDIAKFTGLDPKTQHSRVDVTKFLCKYIKDKNLQNPEDKRQIRADPALTKLLNYDAKTGEPLTYYHMQKLMKSHFTKPQ
jgi:upstream activation factor subunit UAF30